VPSILYIALNHQIIGTPDLIKYSWSSSSLPTVEWNAIWRVDIRNYLIYVDMHPYLCYRYNSQKTAGRLL